MAGHSSNTSACKPSKAAARQQGKKGGNPLAHVDVSALREAGVRVDMLMPSILGSGPSAVTMNRQTQPTPSPTPSTSSSASECTLP